MEVVITNQVLALLDRRLQPYRITGDEARVRTCPVCRGGESNDLYTFSVNLETGAYQCFRGSCQAKGDFRRLASLLGEQVDANPRSTLKTATIYNPPASKCYALTDDIIAYFANRGISEATLNAYGVSADEKGNILFPFTLNGELIYVKHRKLKRAKNDPKEWMDKDTRPILFGMDLCDPSLSLIISEGEIDSLSLYEAGVVNVVSVPAGCENLKWIEECWDWLEQFDDIILFGDNDVPGRRMVAQVVKRLGESRCRIVDTYPLDIEGRELKDANEILVELGDLELRDCLDGAKDIPIKGLIDLSTVIPEDPTTIPRIKTNIPALDESIGGLREGAVTVFTGRPGNGKSTVAGLLLLNAIEAGHSVCAYSGELGAAEFQEWINLQAAGSEYITLKHDPVRGCQVPVVPEDVADAIKKWYAGKFFLFDNQQIFEMNQSESIIEVFTTAIRKYGCKLFLVDNLMMVTSDTDDETRAQGKFMNMIKRFANKYQVHVIIVAHPRKAQYGKTTIGQDDIGGNSATIRLAHNGIVVEKPNLRVIKSRDTGRLRLIECCYCPDSHRIYQKNVGDLNHFSWDRSDVVAPKIKACDNPDYEIQVGEAEGEMF